MIDRGSLGRDGREMFIRGKGAGGNAGKDGNESARTSVEIVAEQQCRASTSERPRCRKMQPEERKKIDEYNVNLQHAHGLYTCVPPTHFLQRKKNPRRKQRAHHTGRDFTD